MVNASLQNSMYIVEFTAVENTVIQTKGTKSITVFIKIDNEDVWIKHTIIGASNKLTTLDIAKGLKVQLQSKALFTFSALDADTIQTNIEADPIWEAAKDSYYTKADIEAKGYLTEHQDLTNYVKVVDLEGVNTRLTTLETTINTLSNYDDTDLRNKIVALEAKEDKDTIYNDESVVNQLNILAQKVNALEVKEDNDTIYNDSELRSRVSALEDKNDNDTIYDDSELRDLISDKSDSSLVSQLLTRIQLLESKNTVMKYASDSATITAIETPASTDLVVTSKEAVEALTADKTYKSIAIVGGDTEVSVKIKATENVVIDGLEINGEKDGGNGKINYTTPSLEVKNVVINACNSNYNVFEGSQTPTDEATLNKNIIIDGMEVTGNSLTHNVMNIYTPAPNAKIIIKNSNFDLNVAKSNVLRISNTPNSDNVEVLFENVNWTYENIPATDADFIYAGLVLYQPYGTDVCSSGDNSHISTWTFKFKNCKYNGELVTSNNFGTHKQAIYGYSLGGSKKVSDLSTIVTCIFE